MTKQEAIKVLKKDLKIIDDPKVTMTAREWEEHDDHMRDALEMAIEALEREPKRGYWLEAKEEDPCWYRCSECGRLYDLDENYCPNCGARMEGNEQ